MAAIPTESLPLAGGRDGAGVRVHPLRTADMLSPPALLERPGGPGWLLRGLGLHIPRSRFNDLATKGTIKQWREAFEHGDAKATGIEQVMKLIVNVVERQEDRSRTRKARSAS